MAKFMAGDRVRRFDGYYNGMSAGDEDTVVSSDGAVTLEKYGYGHADYNLELVTPAPAASPIRTITKREIAAGTYGNVEIDEVGKTYVNIDSSSIYYANDLRAAAKLFNEIADVLDENAKEAA